jgi:hypothetical protein
MSLPACSHCVFAARARAHGAATEWMISALAVFMVGLLCLEAAWWQIHRLRLSVALMEAGRAASRHDSNAFSDIDRTMRHAFAHAWHSPPRRGGLCRQASRPLPCWTLTRVPARPGAPSATLRLHAQYAYRSLTPMVQGVLRTAAPLARSVDTRAAYAQGAILIRLDLHIENGN